MSFRLPYFMTMWWARLFALTSLLSFLLVAFQDTLEGRYVLFLLGFVQTYIISVQHGSITFPRNRGGMFKIAADISWLLLTGSILHYALFHDIGAILPFYKLGFVLFIVFQFFPLITYRYRTVKRLYDVPAASFMLAGAIWGLTSILVSGKAFLHLVFLGFQLHTFLGCMYFMLPRFSRKVGYEISTPLALLVFILTEGAMLLNFLGFAFNYSYLKVAAVLLGIALLLFLFQMRGVVFNYPITFGVLFFLTALVFAFQYDRTHHVPFMLLGMGSFALGMGKRWYMLHFGRGNSDWDLLYHASYVFLILTPLNRWAFLPSAAFFSFWVFLNARSVRTLRDEMLRSLLNWWRV